MDLDAVAGALAQQLADTGLRAHSEVPSTINPPAAVIGMGAGGWVDFDNDMTVQFGVLVVVSAANAQNAQKLLRGYCATDGDTSIRTALEVDNLTWKGSDLGVDVSVDGWDSPAVINIGGIDYLGVEFRVEVVE